VASYFSDTTLIIPLEGKRRCNDRKENKNVTTLHREYMDRVKIHLDISVVMIAMFMSTLLMPSLGQTSRFRYKVDKSEILLQFQKQLFKPLNSKLEEFQKAFDEDYQAEDYVFDAFEAFKKADTAYEPIMQNWVKQFPDSYAPYVARAEYYCACALQARGNKRVIEKGQNEYKEMERFYSLALLDMDQALKLNVGMDVCYALKVGIGMALEKEELITNALIEATKNHPYEYRVRLKYLQTLTPRNGGSYEKMEGFIASCAKSAVYNPKIKELSAAIPADKGSTFSYLGKYGQAVNMYTEALKYSNCHSYFADRGDAYAKLQNYKQALEDYDRALELSPNDPEYLLRKTRAIVQQNRFNDAQKMQRQSNQADTYDDWPPKKSSKVENEQAIKHAQKGNEFMRAGQYEQAISEYTEAIRFLPDEYILYHNRALCYLQSNNDEAALQDFLHAIERKRDDIEAYIKITTIYANRGMYDEAINSMNSALVVKPDDGELFYYRGKVYERRGMNNEAMQDIRQACEMGYQRACWNVMYK
jgi:tetratricopeptide (TPR) repeat protein